MGYNTRFKGELNFTCEMTAPMLAKVASFFGEDPREHPEWKMGKNSGYIDLAFTKSFRGIRWDDGTEKTYYLENSVNLIIDQMRKEWPQFGLSGALLAQGEEIEDRWELAVDATGRAERRPIAIPGTKITCPHCLGDFMYDAKRSE